MEENLINTYKKGNQTLKIYQDDLSDNNRSDWDNLGTITAFHKKYNLSDEDGKLNSDEFNSFDELKTYLIEDKKALNIMPLYLFDHSGLSISTTPFTCRWDSGQIGFIYTTKEQIKLMGVDKKDINKQLIQEIKTYDEILKGEVYGFTLTETEEVKIVSIYKDRTITTETTEEKDLESCFGFIGNDGYKSILEDNGFKGVDEE